MEDEYGSSARLLPPAEEKVAPRVEQVEQKVEPSVSGEQICLPFATEADGSAAQECLCFDAKIEPAPIEDHIEGSFAIGVEAPEECATAEPIAQEPPAENKIESEVQKEAVIVPVAEESPCAEGKVEAAIVTEKVDEAVSVEPQVEAAVVASSAEIVPALAKVEPVPVESHVDAPAVQEKVRKVSAQEKSDRPFRVKLRGSVLVLVRLPNKRSVRAAIHQLSTTGGVIHLEKPLDEKLEVEMVFHLQKSTIQGKAQMLFPMWATQGWMQPFRFVNLTDASRAELDLGLKAFLGEAAQGAAAGG